MINKLSITLIEDDLVYSDAILHLLNYSSYIDRTPSYTSIEHYLTSEMVETDVILLDIKLPGMNGIEGIKEIRKRANKAHIIMLTMFDDDDNIFNAMVSGADGYILKSDAMKTIELSLVDVIKGGAAMSPFIAKKILSMFRKFSMPKQDYSLTSQEKNILSHVVQGYPKKLIADSLFISLHTVQSHFKNIYSKLHVHSQTELVSKVLKEQLV